MDIILLDYYLRLFAILTNLFPWIDPGEVKAFIRNSVLRELNEEIKLESLQLFQEYLAQYTLVNETHNQQVLYDTLQQIDAEIPGRQKFQILLRILLFRKYCLQQEPSSSSDRLPALLENIAHHLHINPGDFINTKSFIAEDYYQVQDFSKLMIASENGKYHPDMPILKRKNLQGQIAFLYISSPTIILFQYNGNQTLLHNKQLIRKSKVYFFHPGGQIKGEGFETIYYNTVIQKFRGNHHTPLQLGVHALAYHYKNSANGLHELNLTLEAEQLVGIIGRSGVGKSTLVNLLIGNKKPGSGTISLNGYDLQADEEKLDGLIGYVSQDDLLFEELTVSENLLFNARLCLGNLPEETLTAKVESLLQDLDLYEVRDLQVGSSINRLISGGQRKKLNIALELIREPWILFADEPTSGLSSSDSEEIMQLLSEQTSRGKIVVVNIHQPSSDIFKLFDKIIVLDKEGYPVFFGNPMEAIPYFNDYYQRIYVNTDICEVCENVNPEAIFKVMEEKKVNEFGEYIRRRKTMPYEWHQHYLRQHPASEPPPVSTIPKVQFNKPGALRQFLIFSKRNFKTKRANLQYLLLTAVISPILAFVLAGLCRYNNLSGKISGYSFADNENIPSYFFMSVIVALFLGLIMSAEEIIRDRKIIMRETFLKLSRLSYVNSKIAFIFLVSALQTLLYVIIGNLILDIRGMNLAFWIILFSTSCFANMVGLLISSLLNSVIAVYILVPLIIVPQMLLSGVVVKYDKINKYLSSGEYVPFVGDIMASRWAYEAMVVEQFSDNRFQRNYFEIENQESNIKFDLLFVIPEIKKSVQTVREKEGRNSEAEFQFIRYESAKLNYPPLALNQKLTTIPDLNDLESQLDKLSDYLSKKLDACTSAKDRITATLTQKQGGVDNYLYLKAAYYNTSMADLLLQRKELEPYQIKNNRIIRELEPVYQPPGSNCGRAHFLASRKQVFGKYFKTWNFNVLIIWAMSAFTYLMLVFVSKPGQLRKIFLKLRITKHSIRNR